jgi:hypothetical protein
LEWESSAGLGARHKQKESINLGQDLPTAAVEAAQLGTHLADILQAHHPQPALHNQTPPRSQTPPHLHRAELAPSRPGNAPIHNPPGAPGPTPLQRPHGRRLEKRQERKRRSVEEWKRPRNGGKRQKRSDKSRERERLEKKKRESEEKSEKKSRKKKKKKRE